MSQEDAPRSDERTDGVYPYLCQADIQPIPDKPQEFAVTIGNPPRRVVLGASALALAQTFDGLRTCAEIAADLIDQGVPLPSPDFVKAMAQQLASIGLVLLSNEPLKRKVQIRGEQGVFSTNPLRHRCLGCGRSCHGHIIGPLEPEFLERLPKILDILRPLYPDLAQEVLMPMAQEGGDTVYRLAFQDAKACVFLGEDKLCRIHRHVGPEAKPAMCRFFPIRLVQTEDSLRVGISRCYEAHRTYREGEEQGYEQTIAQITGMEIDEHLPPEVRGLNPSQPGMLNDNPQPGSEEEQRQRFEHHIMALLEAPNTTLAHLLAFVCEVVYDHRL
ncbi:MAG: YkgJ family cysteine cluster protein, partial [Myxococcota bacterium]